MKYERYIMHLKFDFWFALQIGLSSEVTKRGIEALATMPSLQACSLECSQASPSVLEALSALKNLTRAEVRNIFLGETVISLRHHTVQCSTAFQSICSLSLKHNVNSPCKISIQPLSSIHCQHTLCKVSKWKPAKPQSICTAYGCH